MKGEQLQNFVEHFLPDQETPTPGASCSPCIPSLGRPDPNSHGFAMGSDAMVYCQWAQRAWLRQGRTEALPSSETGSEEDSSDDTSEPVLPAREKKQRKLWAYRQRTAGWANPLKWTRPAFRRKLNPGFVDALMGWPPNWTSVLDACGPEEMESFLAREREHLRS